MEGGNSTFSVWNECFFACKSGDLRAINRADPDKTLGGIRDKIRKNVGLKFNF